MRAIVPILSFNGGEIGQRALARVDLVELYPKCAEIMENCWASVQGPLSKVPGSEYRANTPSDAVALLRPFIFDEDDVVLLELSNTKIRFHDPADGLIALAGAAATIGNFASIAGSATTGSTSTTLDGKNSRARSTITTAAPATAVTLTFTTSRRPVVVRVGSTAGGEEILADTTLYPGTHILTFTPGAATYYFDVAVDIAAVATLSNLTRVAAGTLELSTPWATDDLPLLRYEQQRDAMWWYLSNKQTRVLERRGAASWSLRLFQPEDGPFEPTNTDDDITLTPDALTKDAVLESSEPLFALTDVGRLVRLTHQGQTVTESFTASSQSSDAIRVTGVEGDRSFQLTIAGTWTGSVILQRSVGNDIDFADYGSAYTTNQTVNLNDDLDNQIIYYRVYATTISSGTADITLTYSRGSTTGYARIAAFTDSEEVEIDILTEFGKLTATTEWALGAWCDTLGWPTAGTLFDGRHWLVREDRLIGSVSDDYESFLVGSDASAAVDRFLATGDVNAARWIEGASRLMIGTSGAAVEVRASSFDEPITPDNMNARSIANKGKGAAHAQAEKIDKRIIYVGKNEKRLYQLVYDLDDNSYAPDDLTRLHKTIAGEGFVEIAIQYEPEPRVWAVRADGVLAVLTFVPEEGVYAWCRFVDDGEYESVCVLPGSPEDSVWFVVKRTIDGDTVRFVEKLATENWDDISEAWRLRAGLAATDPADETISGLDHLEGETVYAWADGRVQGPFTVDGGEIELAEKSGGYDYVIVGLNYTGTYKSAKLSYGAALGTALCQQKKFDHVGFVTHQCVTGSFKYGRGTGEGECNEWPTPDAVTVEETMLAAPLTPISRDDNNPFNSGSSTDPRLYIIMHTPAPVEILGAVVHIETNDKQ